MSHVLETHFVVRDRLVLTYERNGWPAAVVTGHEDIQDGRGFHVEHVIVFHAGALRPLLDIGLEEAWSRGYDWVAFTIPRGFPHAAKLTRIARRLGFRQYGSLNEFDHYVRYRP